MTLSTRSALDLIDQAFIGRCAWESATVAQEPCAAAAELPLPLVDPPPSAPCPVATQPVAIQPVATQPVAIQPLAIQPQPLPIQDPLLARLLDAVPEQWLQVVEQIEDALAAGCRVFACTAGRSGEGCTTVARGVFHALSARGHRVAYTTRPPLQVPGLDAGDREGDQADIVIVDAGVWFPPGPVRRRHVSQQAFGCDAALLVRRADRPPCAAHGVTLAAIGLQVLGEVITFTSPQAGGLAEQPHD